MPLSPRARLLGERLERLYKAYGPETVASDPILFLGRYRRPQDIEAVAWISAAFSYGRVETIQSSLERILSALGPGPAAALDGIGDFRRFARESLPGFRHRFHNATDASVLLFAIASARARAGSVRAFFEDEFREEDDDVGPLLSRVVEKLQRLDYRPVLGRRALPEASAARFFFPDPADGSACKRWNLLLRWMVRRDRLDYGLWAGIPTSRLIVPTDTHVHLVGRRLELTRRRSADWTTAREITRALARFDREDPVRYDYALCRIGILGLCQPRAGRSRCQDCLARDACSVGRRRRIDSLNHRVIESLGSRGRPGEPINASTVQ